MLIRLVAALCTWRIGAVFSPALPTAREWHRHFFRQTLPLVSTLTVARDNAVFRETLRTAVKILTDIVVIMSPEVSSKFIVSKHVTESVQNIIGNLRGRGCKRVRGGCKFPSVKNFRPSEPV